MGMNSAPNPRPTIAILILRVMIAGSSSPRTINMTTVETTLLTPKWNYSLSAINSHCSTIHRPICVDRGSHKSELICFTSRSPSKICHLHR